MVSGSAGSLCLSFLMFFFFFSLSCLACICSSNCCGMHQFLCLHLGSVNSPELVTDIGQKGGWQGRTGGGVKWVFEK